MPRCTKVPEAELFFGVAQLGQHQLSALAEDFSKWREAAATAGPQHQCMANHVFELPQRLGRGGLGDMQGL
jgi:hypothetical protein